MFYFLNWKVIEISGEGRRRQEKHWSGSGKITLMMSASKGDDGLRLSAQTLSELLKPVYCFQLFCLHLEVRECTSVHIGQWGRGQLSLLF